MPQVLAEIRHAGFGKSAYPEAAAVAQIYFIRVHLENLLLGEALLQLERKHGFG